LTAVTILNELRAARWMGGADLCAMAPGEKKDNSLWNVWDTPRSPMRCRGWATVTPGHTLIPRARYILRVTGLRSRGKRSVTVDTTSSIRARS